MKNMRDRRVKIPTPERLENIALYYLSRFAASEASLRKVLQNRIRKAALRDPDFANESKTQQQLRSAIETIIGKHRKSGALNDKAYADMKAAGLRRAGKSGRAIKMALAKKGIARDLAAGTLSRIDEENGAGEDAEMKAAKIFAKRKKLGPFSAQGAAGALDDMKRFAAHRKQMGVMARAGFSLDVIRKVLGAEADEE